VSAGSGASVSVAAGDLARFVARAVERLGVPEPDAWSVAELMVEADLRGYDTHGVFRLRQYVNRLRDGGINPRPRLAVVTEGAAIDAGVPLHRKLWQELATIAGELGIEALPPWSGTP
jgi:LDH2 family malate/lactate/ureidoglycolate dehydrogenase